MTPYLERFASLYPGRAKCGVTLWECNAGSLRLVYTGSLPLEQVADVLDVWNPELTWLALTDKDKERGLGSVRLPLRLETQLAHPEWQHSRAFPPGPLRHKGGVYGQRSWRVGWHELINRRDYLLKNLTAYQISYAAVAGEKGRGA